MLHEERESFFSTNQRDVEAQIMTNGNTHQLTSTSLQLPKSGAINGSKQAANHHHSLSPPSPATSCNPTEDAIVQYKRNVISSAVEKARELDLCAKRQLRLPSVQRHLPQTRQRGVAPCTSQIFGRASGVPV